MSDKDLPTWAAEWISGTCGCGARLVRPDCFCGGHVACSASGYEAGLCPRRKVEP